MTQYYISEVDRDPKSIYCHHDHMGEVFIPEHKHVKGQLLYTEGGIVHVKTPTKTYFLPALHFMWLPPGVLHSIHPSSPEVVMRNLYFPVANSDSNFFRTEGIYPVNNLILELLLFTNKWNGNLPKASPNFHIALSLKYLLDETGLEILPLSLPLPSDSRLRSVLVHLEENLGEPLLFSHLAKMFGFSERSLYRLFQKDLNMSYMQYYTVRRILRAIELLIEGKMSVGQIASEVGYNSVPTFSNTFLSILGKRPSDYMKTSGILKADGHYHSIS